MDNILNVGVKTSKNYKDLPLPSYSTAQSSGLDLLAAIERDIIIQPLSRELIACGIYISIPNGYEAQIRSRSGLALKNGIMVLNSPGTIDSDYRGEIMVILANFGKEDFLITRGMRIAQMVFSKCYQVSWNISELENTNRGEGGFGSTGL